MSLARSTLSEVLSAISPLRLYFLPESDDFCDPRRDLVIAGGFSLEVAFLTSPQPLWPSASCFSFDCIGCQVRCFSGTVSWLSDKLCPLGMKLGFLDNIPWLKAYLNMDAGSSFGPPTMVIDQPAQRANFDISFWGWSILSILPLAIRSQEKTRVPPTIHRKSMRNRQSDEKTVGVRTAMRFRPYVSKVPWHTGTRAFLSQLFPRYGHYCGPNWSSGKAGGSPVWDQRPVDWLDFCCYCHDMGYDTHHQAKLLEADLEFLRCLETQNGVVEGDARVAHLYKIMCVAGLKNFLIPYRMNLMKLRSSGQPVIDFGWVSNLRWKDWTFKKP